jgi:hypothetical protein
MARVAATHGQVRTEGAPQGVRPLRLHVRESRHLREDVREVVFAIGSPAPSQSTRRGQVPMRLQRPGQASRERHAAQPSALGRRHVAVPAELTFAKAMSVHSSARRTTVVVLHLIGSCGVPAPRPVIVSTSPLHGSRCVDPRSCARAAQDPSSRRRSTRDRATLVVRLPSDPRETAVSSAVTAR